MRSLREAKAVTAYLDKLSGKLARQIDERLVSLCRDPFPQDCKKLKGEMYRVDSGEYRIVYEVTPELIDVLAVGKRNDDEIYVRFRRIS